MQWKDFHKTVGIFIIVYHVLLAIALPTYFYFCTPSLGIIISSVVLFALTGLSITGGYHRFYAHTTYKTHPVVEAFLLFFGAMAAQGSALRWSFDHRLHHAYSDTDQDPYTVTKGFWHAHIWWLFRKPRPIDTKVVADLTRNPLVMFQHNYYSWCMVATNALMFVVVGILCSDFFGAFVFAWWTRMFVLHHSTWFINSLAHYWGARSFCKEQTAVDNYVISLLTFGEGYHNYHHTFANDYRNGIKWYHFDPTKWFIYLLSCVGLARGLKKVNHYHIVERLVETHKNELFEKICSSISSGKEEVMQAASSVYAGIVQKIQTARSLLEQYQSSKKEEGSYSENVKGIKAQIKELQKAIRQDWKQCKAFAKSIQKLEESHLT